MGKESASNAGISGDAGPVPGWGQSPGGAHDDPLQYSCLENFTDGEAWYATVHGITELHMAE